ncbi:acyl-CoA thioesterase [Williamsia maris]|uniref:Acyl-CoA thioesterase-2 n=1 Tax=Williamsia maris TaxID=72806 RepID=A0ABT1H8N8_9NOCA|nr:acyl-CoA thioesterase domain-containing protein [Williamsia maris]MCP2174621.1 acyl-CoA thioesterase-2 [Williamsia maris]
MAVASEHVFGGLVLAQAVVAAGRSVDSDRSINSLHAYFLRAGDPSIPLTIVVERIRDGRSFSHRKVEVLQGDRCIAEMLCSFAVSRPGVSHQTAMPTVPAADDLLDDAITLGDLDDPRLSVTRMGPFEFRAAETHSRIARDRGEKTDRSRMWLRAKGSAPADALLQTALLVYASDMTVLDPTARPHALALSAGDLWPTSLDHAVWFHQPVAVDSWFLLDLDSPWAGDGRGLARGRVFTADGILVAEIAQEGLLRAGS